MYSSFIDREMQIEKNIRKGNYIFGYQLLEYKDYFHHLFKINAVRQNLGTWYLIQNKQRSIFSFCNNLNVITIPYFRKCK